MLYDLIGQEDISTVPKIVLYLNINITPVLSQTRSNFDPGTAVTSGG